MAQLNITLNQDEILQLLSDNHDEALRKLLTDSINAILNAESAAQLGAEPYERTAERTDSRNGYRERTLKTRIGSITLAVPRHPLVASMAEMVVNGVSTRKVSKVMETLCGTSFSKSTVSEVCKELDAIVNEFKNRQLNGIYPFLLVDVFLTMNRKKHGVRSLVPLRHVVLQD